MMRAVKVPLVIATSAAQDFVDAGDFPQANAVAMAEAAKDGGMQVTGQEVVPPNSADFGAHSAAHGWPERQQTGSGLISINQYGAAGDMRRAGLVEPRGIEPLTS